MPRKPPSTKKAAVRRRSINPSGRATPRSLAAAVLAALQRAADAVPAVDATRIELVADALVAKACAGDVQAIKAVFERIDGKVTAEQAAEAPRAVKIIHSFPELGSGCGLIGPNAVAQIAGRFFWMSPTGEFYAYDGSYPQPLQCTLKRDVKDNLAWVQQDKIYAFPVAARNEVWWLYPDSRDGNECSRYVIYNFVENHWSCGTFDRTAWADAGAYQYPLAVDDDGRVWFQEKGFTEDGGARSWSVTSAFVDIGDGDSHTRLVGIQPDADDLQGGYGITVTTRIHNGDGITSRTFGPYNVTALTGKVSARANGQEAALKFAGTAAPAFWRLGAVRVNLEGTGRRR